MQRDSPHRSPRPAPQTGFFVNAGVSVALKLIKFIHHQLSYCFCHQEGTVSPDTKDSSL